MNYETRATDFDSTADVLIDETDEGARRRRRRLIVAVLIAAALVALAVWLLTRSGDDVAFAPGDEVAPAITVATPGRGSIESIINATGTLSARRAMPVGVVGEGGRVVSVRAEAGDWVSAGQVLAVIDRAVQTEQAQSLAAQIEVARADADLAQVNLDRALQLVDRGFISRAEIDRLTATRDAARARVSVAEAQHRELLARNERLNVFAPEAGFVLERNVEPGQVVGSGSGVLFSIARGGEMELLIQLGESDLARIAPGVTAAITPVGTDQTFTCRVWQLLPVINEQNRQGTARCAMPYASELRPGGFATARINSGTVVAPVLPESAILSDDGGSFVFIVDGENKVVRRPVELGIVTGEGIAIASGLTGEERVVLRAGGFLTEGETVRPVAGSSAG